MTLQRSVSLIESFSRKILKNRKICISLAGINGHTCHDRLTLSDPLLSAIEILELNAIRIDLSVVFRMLFRRPLCIAVPLLHFT
jgi:hypothetical protein